VLSVLQVDEEIRPDRITRQLSLQGPTLCMHFAAADLKFLRVAVSSFLEAMMLVVRTINQFQ